MKRQVVLVAAEAVDPGILPDIRAIAAGLAETEGVQVLCGADLVDEDQFVAGAIEGPHAAIGLDPDHKVLELGIDLRPRSA